MSPATGSTAVSAETEAILAQIDWLRQAVQESSARNIQIEEQLRSEKGRQSDLVRDHQARLRALQLRSENAERRVSGLEGEIEARAHEILRLKAELERAVGEIMRMREVLRQAVGQERETQRVREQLILEIEHRTHRANQQRQIDLDGIRDRDRAIAERDQVIAELRTELDRRRSGAEPLPR